MKTWTKVLLIVLALIIVAGVCCFLLKDKVCVSSVETGSNESEDVAVEIVGEEISIESNDTLSELISELD